jgi:hypothetical protein
LSELKVYLSDELAKRFRKAAMDAYGYGRGSISKAAAEAFSRWCAEQEVTLTVREKAGTISANTAGSAETAQTMAFDPRETNNSTKSSST